MSYRLIDSNAIAIKYPEVNEMPCIFADLPDGLNGQFIGWMPCSEQLPNDYKTVLFASPYSMSMGWHDKNGWHYWGDRILPNDLVLWWMPLPKHPALDSSVKNTVI